jgi:hypothetical protein
MNPKEKQLCLKAIPVLRAAKKTGYKFKIHGKRTGMLYRADSQLPHPKGGACPNAKATRELTTRGQNGTGKTTSQSIGNRHRQAELRRKNPFPRDVAEELKHCKKDEDVVIVYDDKNK